MRRRTAICAWAATVAAPRLAGAQAADALTIALVPVENAAQAYFADELGFFAKARIAADLQPLSNGGAIASAVASGAADIGFATVIPIALAHTKGLPLQFVSAGYVSNDKLPTSAMLVLPDAPIHRGADLDGKLAATNGLATINEYVPRAWIDGNGGDSDRVRFAEMPFSGMPSALAAGRVDAIYVAEPFATVAKAHARVLFYGTAITRDGEMLGGWFAENEWARTHADLVHRFDGGCAKRPPGRMLTRRRVPRSWQSGCGSTPRWQPRSTARRSPRGSPRHGCSRKSNWPPTTRNSGRSPRAS